MLEPLRCTMTTVSEIKWQISRKWRNPPSAQKFIPSWEFGHRVSHLAARPFQGPSEACPVAAQGHCLASYRDSVWSAPTSPAELQPEPPGSCLWGGVSVWGGLGAPGHHNPQSHLSSIFPSRISDFAPWQPWGNAYVIYKSLHVSWVVFKIHTGLFPNWTKAKFPPNIWAFFVYFFCGTSSNGQIQISLGTCGGHLLFWSDQHPFSCPWETAARLFLGGTTIFHCTSDGTVNEGLRGELRPKLG